jgi:L-lactate dehydrogenase (cytochrome)
LLLKGVFSATDAAIAVSLGVDGIHLSNHGGRQLDRVVPAVSLVRPVRDSVGDKTVIVLDSGITHGADVAIGLALGADLCGVGRAYLYGLAVGGDRGVEHVVRLLSEQLTRTMTLLGVKSLEELRSQGRQLISGGCIMDAEVG